MIKCGYKGKGCAKEYGCDKSHGECNLAKYFDFLVGDSKECQSNVLSKKEFVDCWRDRQVIDSRCVGCANVTTGQFNKYCTKFVKPFDRWPDGEVTVENKCLHATHVTKTAKASMKKVNPLKASRRKKAGRG